MQKYIIIGARGMLGSYVHRYFKANKIPYYLVGEYFQNESDIRYFKKTTLTYNAIFPEDAEIILINCAGNVNKTDNVTKLVISNTLLPRHLTKYFNKVIHISTDCVFENDYYALSKRLGEPENAMVIRTSFVGRSAYGRGLLEWYLSQREQVYGYVNHLYDGLTCLALAKLLPTLEFRPGNFNYRLEQKTNKYQLLKHFETMYNGAEVIKKDTAKVDRTVRHPEIVETKSIQELLYEQKEFDDIHSYV